MAILTNRSSEGLTFHGNKITANPQELINILGWPQYQANTGLGETNFKWTCENELGELFTIYDRYERRALNFNDGVDWCIGGHCFISTQRAKEELLKLLK